MADLTGMLQAAAGVSTGNPNAWDVSKAYYDAGSVAGDISKAVYPSISFSVASQETGPSSCFFKPDGTKMYVIGGVGDAVNEYTLSTPWLVTSASYVQAFSVAAQETNPTDVFLKPDGTKMYVVGSNYNKVSEYNLSSAWDVSTASYVQDFNLATQGTSTQGIFFKPDGTKMYVTNANNDVINEYALSSAWDVSTASYVQNLDVSVEESIPTGVSFLDDGTKVYICGSNGDEINEYSLSTPWDISTASYVQNFSVASQDASPQGMYMKGDGSLFYMVGTTNDTVYQYFIGGFSVNAQDATPESIFFKPDGTKMYIAGNANNSIVQYDLSTAWDVNSATYIQSFSVNTEEISPNGLFFSGDGTRMYICGLSGDEVNQYSLSVAWDISTASFVQLFSVSAQDTSATGVFFKTDGTKMYVIGSFSDNVNEYNLSTAWDISTASYAQAFSVLTEQSASQDLYFRDDGTKLYVIGSDNSSGNIHEYNLGTPWDVSTASYVQMFSATAQESSTRGLFFNPDGEQFFVIGITRDRVFSYSISAE